MGGLVRRADPDRFLSALFAPADRRDALFTLYAFNHETARAQLSSREPAMALIRLQWWREIVEGAVRAHEVASPLSALLADGALDPADLLSVLDAREETERSSVADWLRWLRAGPGALAVAAARLLGAENPEAVRNLGAGYGAAGVLRNTAALARGGLCLLPADLLAAHGLGTDAVVSRPDHPALQPVFAALAEEGRRVLGSPARRGKALAAALPAILGRRDLRNPGKLTVRSAADRLAVTLAALRGRA